MKKNTIQFRQGDVLLEKVETIPSKAKVKTKDVAFGEHSNHGHFITGEADVLTADEQTYVDVAGNAKLEHLLINSFNQGSKVWTQEHKAIDLPAGKYRVIQQVEYNPYEKAIEQVRD